MAKATVKMLTAIDAHEEDCDFAAIETHAASSGEPQWIPYRVYHKEHPRCL